MNSRRKDREQPATPLRPRALPPTTTRHPRTKRPVALPSLIGIFLDEQDLTGSDVHTDLHL